MRVTQQIAALAIACAPVGIRPLAVHTDYRNLDDHRPVRTEFAYPSAPGLALRADVALPLGGLASDNTRFTLKGIASRSGPLAPSTPTNPATPAATGNHCQH